MIRFSTLRRSGVLVVMLLAAPLAAAQEQTQPPPIAPPLPRMITPAADTIANPQPDHPAYGDLLDAIESTVDKNVLISNGLATIKRQMQSDAGLASAETASPGLLDEILAGMRPILERQNLRVTALYRPRMAAAMADYLTPEEATSVAAFYRSDIGRKLMSSVVANYSMDQTMANAIADKDVTEADVRADINSAVVQGMKSLDSKDMVEMTRQAMSNPALIKLNRVNPRIQRLRAQMENEALLPEEEAMIGSLMESVLSRRFPQ